MIKVCNLVKLLEKDEKGLYKKDGQHKVVRANAKVLAESVTETENNYVDSGMIYIVDEEATKAWHKAKEAKANPVKATKATKEEKATDKE
jgi:hypothetical protein